MHPCPLQLWVVGWVKVDMSMERTPSPENWMGSLQVSPTSWACAVAPEAAVTTRAVVRILWSGLGIMAGCSGLGMW